LLSGLIIIIITTLLTILISHLSYRYFESYFLRIKNQYSIIQTG
jgi:peptidoglycan/LPS O-acetylase OafA/YrhL